MQIAEDTELNEAFKVWCRLGRRKCKCFSRDPVVNGTEEHDEAGEVITRAEVVYTKENDFCNCVSRPLDYIIADKRKCPLISDPPYDYLNRTDAITRAKKERELANAHKGRKKRRRRRHRKKTPVQRKPGRPPKKKKKSLGHKRAAHTAKLKPRKVIKRKKNLAPVMRKSIARRADTRPSGHRAALRK